VVDVAANGITKEPGSSVGGKVMAVVPTVPSQSLPPSDVSMGSNVLSARPTKPSSKPYVVGHVLLTQLLCIDCDSFLYLQCPSKSHPRELVFLKEITLGIFLERDSREGRRKSAVFVLRHVRYYRDSRCHLIDCAVRKRYAHRTGADVAWCAT
jgi:hypothetical protein